MRDATVSQLRFAARLANGFALDLVKLGGFGRDVLDGLLLAAISQANVAQITRSAELQRRYATLDAVPPDNLRRPVSINAIATSLRIPFETARRRIAHLGTAGVLSITPQGVIVPSGAVNSELYRFGAEANYRLVRELYSRLRGAGVLADLPRAPAGYDDQNLPVRLVIRLSSDYLLRLAEPVTKHVGDLVTGLVLMDVIHANTEHLSDQDEASIEDGPIPDSLRRPVRVAKLSARLGIPQETVRRHLARLVATDRCDRTEAGYVVPTRVVSRPQYIQHVLANQVNLQRLFSALAEHGVLAMWDGETQALKGAA